MGAARFRHPKAVIGLAGGIGSGKSLVAGQLASLGCGIVDADALARAALAEQAVRASLVARWGQGVLDADGSVDRKAVAAKVFEQPEELAWLESIVHPRVHAGREALRQRYFDDAHIQAVVEDCPLLFEKGLDKVCDVTVFVEADRSVREARLRADRGWDAAELARREKNQWPLDIKAARADYVVKNDADPGTTLAQVRDVFSQIFR